MSKLTEEMRSFINVLKESNYMSSDYMPGEPRDYEPSDHNIENAIEHAADAAERWALSQDFQDINDPHLEDEERFELIENAFEEMIHAGIHGAFRNTSSWESDGVELEESDVVDRLYPIFKKHIDPRLYRMADSMFGIWRSRNLK